MFDRVEKEMESSDFLASPTLTVSANVNASSDAKAGRDFSISLESSEIIEESVGSKYSMEKGGKKKKGKTSGNTKAAAVDSSSDNSDFVPTKSKKNQRKGKDTSSSNVSEVKSGSKKDNKLQEDSPNVPSVKWVVQKIMTLFPDWEEQG